MNWLQLVDRPDWMRQAACADMNSDLFFPQRGASTDKAKAACRACPVRAECLAYAMNTGERFGIWGGLSERERRQLRRDRRRAARDPIGHAEVAAIANAAPRLHPRNTAGTPPRSRRGWGR